MRLSRNVNLFKYKHAWRLVTTVAHYKAYNCIYTPKFSDVHVLVPKILCPFKIAQNNLISRKSCDITPVGLNKNHIQLVDTDTKNGIKA